MIGRAADEVGPVHRVRRSLERVRSGQDRLVRLELVAEGDGHAGQRLGRWRSRGLGGPAGHGEKRHGKAAQQTACQRPATAGDIAANFEARWICMGFFLVGVPVEGRRDGGVQNGAVPVRAVALRRVCRP